MVVWSGNGWSRIVVALAVVLSGLAGCEKAPEEAVEKPASVESDKATAPGVITGNETLPAGHPPIAGLQGAAAATTVETEMDIRPEDEPEHPPNSGKELVISVPDSIREGWSAVQLSVALPDGGRKEIRAILGEETPLPDASLTVRAEIFLPAYISDFETIKSASNELTNPAVKVRLYKDKEAVAVGWLFQKYPEFNSFESELAALQLLSAEAADDQP